MPATAARWPFACILVLAVAGPVLPAPAAAQGADVNEVAGALEAKVIAWRRDFHEHPELSNREFRTAGIVAAHLRSLGLEVSENVAHTGVVGVLRGGRPGPVVALRADMDALPVEERNDLPFRSRATAEYNGQTVPVMHACGHDAHVAILMAVAEVLAGRRSELAGTVKFIFQPAEEGAPPGERGGAEVMVEEGVLTAPAVDVAYALHLDAQRDVGTIGYRSGPLMAGVQDFRIVVRGRQAHGAAPWMSVDPIVTASRIVMGLQTIVARNVNITEIPAIVTVGKFTGGVRSNIIPEQVELVGTIRTFSDEQRELVHQRIRDIADHTAASMGATAEVSIPYSASYPVTYNDPKLTEQAVPVLRRVAGAENVVVSPLETGAEDFSFFAREVPGFYFFLGGKPRDVPEAESASHHTPGFFLDESGFRLGVEALLALALSHLGPGI